ncbi:flagellar hook-length control protein FliK [Geomesophilobacter sediminis]|uniref:Flagellar hook-length control protein FliK n=1 Tax=Geomesophilobacter sediminis TaxID=2798584 RepID=A0A8J7M094_9BACT|nr:flagellar hook-length control protein FliK [Geomesophilobacter sediminis]MBJ6724002.1 flagellar hook-length control protein FliK [Geomesophilobacter sediminis]
MLINDEIQRQVLPTIVKATAATPGGDTEQRSASQLAMNPGQQVKAEIIATLPNHMYLARIAGELFNIELPIIMEPGQAMNLIFVSADPRVTFQYVPSNGAESIRFTQVGKWLSTVVENAAPLLPSGPLVEDPMQGADLIAARLREALVQGGLFYESHLAQWAAGNYATQELLKEPQGRLSKTEAKEDADPAKVKQERADGATFADPSTLSLVKEQLSMLRSGLLTWQGEAWPGQDMELVVSRDQGEDGEPAIQANLAVELPQLGAVQAFLKISAEGLSVELACGTPEGTRQLKDGAPDFKAALSSVGLYLGRMAVKDVES